MNSQKEKHTEKHIQWNNLSECGKLQSKKNTSDTFISLF